MKRFISLLCVAVMLLSMCACGSKDAATGESDVTVLTYYVPMSEKADIELIEEEIAKITVPAIGAKLDIKALEPSAFDERMKMNMAAGSKFDLTFTGYVNPYLTAVDKGGLMDITKLIDEHAPALKKALPDYAWDIATVDGKIYAVPNLQGFAPPHSLKARTDLLEKYDFDLNSVKKMEDLEPFLEKVKKGEPNLYPYRTNYGTEMWTYGTYEIITSGIAIKSDGSSPEVFYISETPEYKQSLKTLHDWYKKGYIRMDLLSAGNDADDSRNDKYAVESGGWLPGAEVTVVSGGYAERTFKPMTEPYLVKSKALATLTGIGLGCKNPEKAIKMIELLNTNSELFNLISFGIEGTHYTKNDNGKIVIDSESGYVTNSPWMFGNQFNALIIEGQDDNVWADTEKMNLEAKKSPLLGFVLDTDPIKNEISQISAVSEEFPMSTFIVNGMDSWDKYQKKLDDAGRAKVLKEVQRQVNEYWKTK